MIYKKVYAQPIWKKCVKCHSDFPVMEDRQYEVLCDECYPNNDRPFFTLEGSGGWHWLCPISAGSSVG